MTMIDTMAISLRTTPFQEADQVVSFYSAEYGELRAIAKGVKRSSSKLAGACESLTLNHIYLARGKSLYTLCNYERIESFPHIREDLERMSVGSVCTEVIRLLGRENDQDSAVIFHLLADTLHRLNQFENAWVESSLLFHRGMLQLAGYLPSFDTCISCHQALDLEYSSYFPFFLSLGGFLCRSCYPHLKDAHPVNVSTATMKLFLTPDDSRNYANTIKAHRFLAYYWGHRLDHPVKSFDFLFQVADTVEINRDMTASVSLKEDRDP